MAYRLGMRNTMLANQPGDSPDPRASDPNMLNQPQIQSYPGSAGVHPGRRPAEPAGAGQRGGHPGQRRRVVPAEPDRCRSPTGTASRSRSTRCRVSRSCRTALADTLLNGMSHDIDRRRHVGVPGAGGALDPADLRQDRYDAAATSRWRSWPLRNGYAASSIVFADGSEPGEDLRQPATRHRSAGCPGWLRWSMAAPTFFNAFEPILAEQPDDPDPGPDPATWSRATTARRCRS